VGLRTYRAKRRFDVTPEPRGGAASRRRKAQRRFVVHKHRASQLHYDLRLESAGVLHSWAVPKGPSLDPSVKRLAMAVEDHPIEYATFEGTIPENEYGGGTMMVWDRGTWAPDEPDVERSIARGELKFTLAGEKLHGSWVLVRTGGRAGDARDARSWLLIKHRDDAASREDVAETRPYSVASGRLLAQIAHDEGGDVAKAASGDPPAAVERLISELRATPGPASGARRRARGKSASAATTVAAKRPAKRTSKAAAPRAAVKTRKSPARGARTSS
jgi:bifunctional non-homologous end joining protein LigD